MKADVLQLFQVKQKHLTLIKPKKTFMLYI